MRSVMRFAVTTGLVLLTGACASGGGGGSDLGMAYATPDDAPLTYLRGDSLSASIEIPGMGAIDIAFDQSYALDMDFAAFGGGTRVTATVRDFQGRMSNPVAGTDRAGADAVSGPLVFTLDARGRAELVERPTIRGVTAQVLLRATEVANTVLPRLPGRMVSEGDTWADTISFQEENAVGSMDLVWSIRYTAGGLETWNGRSVRRVETSGQYNLQSASSMQGMYVEQDLSGPESGHFLWDEERGVVVYFESNRRIGGTVDADAAPAPMELRGTSVAKTTLQGN